MKEAVTPERPAVAFYRVEEEIFNAAKQRLAPSDDFEPESEEESLDEDSISGGTGPSWGFILILN